MKKACLNGCFQVLPIEQFSKHPRSPDGLNSRCKRCETKRLQVARHGMTAADKAQRAADQDGCAICGTDAPGAHGWVVDHDRSCCTGDRSCASCRRAILCSGCNWALGHAADNPARLRRMADYLDLQTRLGA